MTLRRHRKLRWAALLLCGAASGCTTTPHDLGPKTLEVLAPPNVDYLERASVEASASQPLATDSPVGRSPACTSCRHCVGAGEVERHLATAREMEAHGDHLAAVEQYERVRSQNPRQSGVSARLAALYEHCGASDRARAEYRRALEESPGDADLWNESAHFEYQSKDFAAAENAAREALRIDPEHRLAWGNLGLVLAEQERYDESLRAFSKAVSPAAAHNSLAVILARQGKRDEARRELAEARRLDPTLQPPSALLKQLSEEFVSASGERGGESVKPPRRNDDDWEPTQRAAAPADIVRR